MHNFRTLNPSADHKPGIARRFSRAAPHYDRYAAFQRACGDRLCALTGPVEGRRILDAGCGTGWFSRRWQAQGNQVVALDLSAAMLGFARQQRSAEAYILGDIERLPLATGSMDIVYSNLAVQWCDDLPRALAELHRVLRPGGILALSTLAQGSLKELAQAWGQVDDGVHINRFLPQAAIAAAFAPYRHRLLAEPYRLHYSQLTDLLREIKGVGAGYLHDGRTPGLTSRSRLRALEANWPHRPAGLPLSYRVVYGIIYRD
ncbi:Malonyl-[acyl-carrier protein] O-methyltransferase [Sodalis glossinidius str. 'morsitans']|uniref:Malonyl-[acyl-carrier protein] O-methyltransferase n=1 Tax=Sodalis glossinidius (strain morsitans) TaxID=343509 RepID=Q2NUJ5_SODGM|nr:malonyl-ACP O-methyltransferase BioC [Sodalis glossinidius]BAE74180.1 biotin synthesis protein BioC [Sodalis glossinidius str. 'morsitans']CRL44741.1 Malonyl-[acyl-carrier protein] O-methyltransferase [Sodalis glossinidius str. 'morsitans']